MFCWKFQVHKWKSLIVFKFHFHMNSSNWQYITIQYNTFEICKMLETIPLNNRTSVNNRKPSTTNFEIPLLDVNSLDKLIKSFPTNVATGLNGISAPLLKAHLSGYSWKSH